MRQRRLPRCGADSRGCVWHAHIVSGLPAAGSGDDVRVVCHHRIGLHSALPERIINGVPFLCFALGAHLDGKEGFVHIFWVLVIEPREELEISG